MLRWTISCLLILFSALVIVANIQIVLRGWRDKKSSGSLVMIVGGLLGAIGLSAVPVHGLHRWWWVPLVLDLGCGVGLLGMAWAGLRTHLGRRTSL
jgi:uncharacterized membrane protein YhaH (DUF805 family)